MSIFNIAMKSLMGFGSGLVMWLAWFWVGIMGGVVAQRMDEGFANQIMAIVGAIFFLYFFFYAVVFAFWRNTPAMNKDTANGQESNG